MTSWGHQDLVVTRATLDDWAVVARWAGDEGWNPGLSDPACFFAQDPEGFFIGRLDGEPVSSVSVVTYGDDYAFLGFYLVRPDRRGRGHGLATWKTALAHAGERTVGLDGVVAQQDNYRQSGFAPAHRTFRYSGVVPATAVPADVRPVHDAALLAAYDRACHPADRPRFLEHWLTADGHRALARIVDGRLTGYGVVRPGRDALRIGPLFADTAADARALFAGLAAEAAGRELAVDVPEPNTAAVALVEEYGLTPSFETARMYTGPIRPYAAERVFGVTTLELG
ncbi:GNAT family N-acetyltransferase [Streptomyces caniscabiei]|uniref:GNAT family N-acetyltransferase n=1 Tax=Streptomyces caniscabiei TaxID=2746961 RepID=A0A927QLV9_9ACTN|nr:GNAT family N-acetyltransferase [Streptomyces caniscabiei]MBD9725249.1 GNAT family N-acetyltransferase [Streptomyces caniscabiei]MDX3510799.1 GNAT family N-acetyltransferase [Streptomyces caniscabiei]MDX3720258.1 GNAT family N-acetyltransferase [Streptomyces caniscabiei]MDX3729423.1 GNAT family N-acetyltransferase [Streptomyces caniscabiei]WEO29360.1 GNAT family N-acetyltransferase [Streptomyces caniscabiei]